MGPCYADAGPEDGILLYRDVAGSIGVFEDPDRSIAIGTARCIGWDAAGSAVWRLEADDEEVQGPWLVVDREFLSTGRDWSHLYRGDSHHELSRPGWASPRRKLRARKRARARTGVQPLPS